MIHGGDLGEAMARHGGEPGEWLDLSTGINPHAWPIPRELPDSAWRRLPGRREAEALIGAAREAYRVPENIAVVPAPGTQALIQWLPRLAAPGSVAVVSPTYDEHERAWASAGHAVLAIADLADLPEDARHVVIVNPNNPDGRIAAPAALARAGREISRRGGWLIVDESFADTDPRIGAFATNPGEPLVALRSFGKFHGLAGLRLGFALAAPSIAGIIMDALGPWAVSGPALAIGTAALADGAWARAMRERLAGEARALDVVLARGGLERIGGTALFRLASHPQAHILHERLAEARIWTRRFDRDTTLLRFGLPSDASGLARLADALHR